MPDTKGRIYNYFKTYILEIFTKGDIFRTHVFHPANLNERVTKVWILHLLQNFSTTREEAHTIIRHGDVLVFFFKFVSFHEFE